MTFVKKLPFLLTVFLLVSVSLTACVVSAPAPGPAEAPAQPAAEAEAEQPAAPPTEAEQAPEAEEVEVAPMVEPLSPPEKVVVAYVPIMKFAPLYVAAHRGIFDKYGLEVDIQAVTSGTEAIAFLSEGVMDVGGIAIVASTWNAWAQGMDLRIIAPGALEPMTDSPTKLLARKELVDSGEVQDVADLRGRVVAMAGGPGSGGEYLAAKALERGGLTVHDVEIVQLGNADMPAALENGSIDAGLLGTPYAEQALNAGYAVSIAEDLTPGAMTVAFVGSGKFVDERPEVAKRFVLALMEAARAMQDDEYLSEENMAAYLAYTNSTPEAVRDSTTLIYDPNQEIPLEGLQDVERVHRENGRTEYTEPIDLQNVVDTSFVAWALGVLGEQ